MECLAIGLAVAYLGMSVVVWIFLGERGKSNSSVSMSERLKISLLWGYYAYCMM